ncbi:MAG: hypothetical protein NT161_00990 [Candidatus Nomurabacteria bacterium]|nr:hypothetical protein [Candidatus Nomurabacteria bacterium]
MKNKFISKIQSTLRSTFFWFFVVLLFVLVLFFVTPEFFGSVISYSPPGNTIIKNINEIVNPEVKPTVLPLDTVAYDKKMEELANNPPDPIVYQTVKTVTKDPKTGKSVTKTTKVPLDPQPVRTHLWPVKTVYPNVGAILPFNRIVAYYGNLYSKNMGVLGQYPETEMLQKLDVEVKKWNEADPSTPAIPALHYITIVAQENLGQDGKYRARMPDSEIDKVLAMAAKINALVFLDIQVGFSNVETEIPLLEKYLKMPQVHLGIDPEFSMKTGIRPGKVVGTVDAKDINFAANYLAKIVKENNLPPKILIVHRYTQKMVTNYKEIKPLPEVQIVMDMDGWGGQAKKINTYQQFVFKEPVQFTGFKLFYKNDVLTPGTTLMTPNQLLKLNPRPIYIQYQ